MIKMRFVCRDNEDVYHTRKTLFGKEVREVKYTHVFRPVLQYQEDDGEWQVVPVIYDKDTWVKATGIHTEYIE